MDDEDSVGFLIYLSAVLINLQMEHILRTLNFIHQLHQAEEIPTKSRSLLSFHFLRFPSLSTPPSLPFPPLDDWREICVCRR